MATTLEATTLESVATSSEVALLPLPPSFEHCIGEEVKSRAGFFHIQCWRPKGVVVSIFVDRIKPEIENLRKTHLPQRPGDEWIGLTCFMIRSLRHLRPQAFPYICFSSIKPEPRKQLRDLVKKEKILEKYPGFRTRDWKMDPDSYGMKSCGSESTAGDDAAYMLRIDSQASCFSGATIHIRQSGMNQAWRLAATSGGLLSNENGTVFLITANHALSNKAYAILPPTIAALDCAAGSDDSSDGDDEPGIDSMALKTIDYTHTLVPLVKSSASLIEKKLSASTSHAEFDSSTLFPPFAVFPEERAPATSSIFAEGPSMRSERSDRPALDYALIQLGSSLSISTVVSLPRRQKFIDSVPKRPERKAVLAVTASYRQIRGHLEEVPTFIMHSRTGGSQEFWKATFEDEIREGDCGSWVFDVRDGAVIGHIVATSSVTGLTLLVPMAQILDDVARRLGGLWVPTISLDQLKHTAPVVSSSSGGSLATTWRETESSTSTAWTGRSARRVAQRKSVPLSKSKRQGSSATPERTLPFACPFAKRDSIKYMQCIFSHQMTVRHMKQHLNRKHLIGPFCPTCGEQFDSQVALREHIVSRNCQRVSTLQLDGITEDQQQHINDIRAGDDTAKWYAMWDIIFPDVPRPETPYSLEPPAEIAMNITKRMQGIDWLDELKNLFLSRQDTLSEDQAEEMAQAVQDLLSTRLGQKAVVALTEDKTTDGWKEPHGLAFQRPLKRNRWEFHDNDSAYETLTGSFQPTSSQYTGSIYGPTVGENTTANMSSSTFLTNSLIQPASFAPFQRAPQQYLQQYHLQQYPEQYPQPYPEQYPQPYPEKYLTQYIEQDFQPLFQQHTVPYPEGPSTSFQPSSLLHPPQQTINNQYAMPPSLGVLQETPVDFEQAFAQVEAETGDKDEEAADHLAEST